MMKAANAGSVAPHALKPFVLSDWAYVVVMLCLASYIVEAPIKYALSFASADKLIYARDLVIVAVLVASFGGWLSSKTASPSSKVVYLLLVHVLFGAIYLESLLQAIIGIKVFFPLLLGVAMFETIRVREETTFKWAQVAFWVSVVGIFLNLFTPMPWAGAIFSSAAGDTEVTREWTTGGVVRLSGFTRASYEAATVIAVTSAPIMMRNSVNLIYLLVVGCVALVTIALTTSKASVLAMLLMFGYAIHFRLRAAGPQKLPKLILVFPLIGLGVPLLLSLYNWQAKVGGDLWWALSSFAERINWMWPRAFEILGSGPAWIFGRGVGGIGFAQRFLEGAKYNSADNVMVYLYLTFGIFSLVYVGLVLKGLAVRANHFTPVMFGCLVSWLIYYSVYGFSTNLIEGALFGFVMGLFVGAAMSNVAYRAKN